MKLFSIDSKNYINYNKLNTISIMEFQCNSLNVLNTHYYILHDKIVDSESGEVTMMKRPISDDLKNLALDFVNDYLDSRFMELKKHLINHIEFCSEDRNGLIRLFDDYALKDGRQLFLNYVPSIDNATSNINPNILLEVVAIYSLVVRDSFNTEICKEIWLNIDDEHYHIVVPRGVDDAMSWFHRKYIFDYSFKSNLKI